MSYYYVTHPNVDFSATVKAPTTDKARTTFLDYLERTGRANRKTRQQLRHNLVAERIDAPEEVNADVNLKYAYIDGDDGEVAQVAYAPQPEGEFTEEETSEEATAEPVASSLPEELPVERAEREFDVAETPIAKFSLGSVK